MREKEIERKAKEWLEKVGQIEKRGDREFTSSYAEGFLDGIEFVLIILKETDETQKNNHKI